MWEANRFLLLLLLILHPIIQGRPGNTETNKDDMKTYGFGLSGSLYKRIKTNLMQKATHNDYLLRSYHDTILEPMLAAIKHRMEENGKRTTTTEIIAILALTIATIASAIIIIWNTINRKRLQRINNQLQN